MAFVNRSNHSKARKQRRVFSVHKANGVLSPRVEAVGPKHFGIVSVDCAKARSKWALCNFYGEVLIAPTVVDHSKLSLDLAILRLREAVVQFKLGDVIVAIERTGRYHEPVERSFSTAGFECRIVHPFATKRFREPANPGNKTDDIDLAAITRATQSGFGLQQTRWDETSRQLQLLARHRRDLVEKRSITHCQIREHLEAFLPGYAAVFVDPWKSATALPIARRFGSADAIRSAGVDGLATALREAGVHFQRPTLKRLITWTCQATTASADAAIHQRVLQALDDDRLLKTTQILELEREIAGLLVQTPYVLLLAMPGINVVSSGELAGEMGPIEHYACNKSITGRAGLFPSRYQSDQVDHADGSLVRCANRALRAALLLIAGNLAVCNHYFRAKAEIWKRLGKDERWVRVKIASIFSRIAFQIVAGRQEFKHPSHLERNYILDKLITFHRDHDTPAPQMLRDLENAGQQLPESARLAEAVPLEALLKTTRAANRRGPQMLADILPIVLAKLGAGALKSTESGERGPS